MMSIRSFSQSLERRAPSSSAFSASSVLHLWLAGFAIIAAAIAHQIHLKVNTDPLWLMDLCGRMLDGQTAYADFLENNPPFAILLYMPPVLAVRFLGVTLDAAFVTYVVLATLVSLGATAAVLRACGRQTALGWASWLTALASLLALPDYAFGQRDHFVTILALPWLAAMGVRAFGDDPPKGSLVWATGIPAGLIFAIKPHYALSFVFVTILVAYRRGLWPTVKFGELLAAVASALTSTLITVVCFPEYFSIMAPMAFDVYAPNRQSMALLLANPTLIASALLAAAIVAWRKRLKQNQLAQVFTAAAASGPISYLVQGKWFAYHNFHCIILLFIVISQLAKPEYLRSRHNIALACGALLFSASALIFLHHSERFIAETGFYVLVAAAVIGLSLAPFSKPALRAVCALGLGCAFAAVPISWQGFRTDWDPSPPFIKQIQAQQGHTPVAIIGNGGGLGIPAAHAAGDTWGMSFIAWILTDSANRLLHSHSLTPEKRAALLQYKDVEYGRFLSDMRNNSPGLIIVDQIWAERNLDKQQIDNILRGYVEISRYTESNADGLTWLLVLYAKTGV